MPPSWVHDLIALLSVVVTNILAFPIGIWHGLMSLPSQTVVLMVGLAIACSELGRIRVHLSHLEAIARDAADRSVDRRQ